MTEQEWQALYEITSLKGRIWKRSEIRKRASEMLKSLLPGQMPLARRTAVQLVLDDATFMRSRKGMVPARVIEEAAIEAMLRLMRADKEPLSYRELRERVAIFDKKGGRE